MEDPQTDGQSITISKKQSIRDFHGLPSLILCVIVAFLHFLFMVGEMFLWTSFMAERFGFSSEDAETTLSAAINQGIYNGGVCGGIIFALFQRNIPIQIYFMIAIFIYAIVGAATVSVTIIIAQGLPALVAAVLLGLRYRQLFMNKD
mmetsp:Transcript_19714/g.17456  ORF Transcript_19714/g.17456 Transcript_19714/m.17456 type:complete len:147 (-) Transcript_19714:72-512(-)